VQYFLIRHQVKDFDRWKPLYAAHKPAREAAGLHEEHLFRDAGNPNLVTILFRAESIELARHFAESPELREKMKQAGVMDKPEMCVMNKA
jgi:hypothetical protein